MKKPKKPKVAVQMRYVILHGPKKESERNRKSFEDIELADAFFKLKQLTEHVSAYKETITTTLEKIA